jgi:hypothetical protein
MLAFFKLSTSTAPLLAHGVGVTKITKYKKGNKRKEAKRKREES